MVPWSVQRRQLRLAGEGTAMDSYGQACLVAFNINPLLDGYSCCLSGGMCARCDTEISDFSLAHPRDTEREAAEGPGED